jgi:hypothetical protein
MDAITNLTLKVESIGKQHQSPTHLAFADNLTWYSQKNVCIDHLCLVGDELKTHHKAMEYTSVK